MPLKHLRICKRCDDKIRWAPCGIACAVPHESDPASWLLNQQDGAGEGTFKPGTLAGQLEAVVE